MLPAMFARRRKPGLGFGRPFHVGGPLPPRGFPTPYGGHVGGPMPPVPGPVPQPYGGGHVGGPMPPDPGPYPGATAYPSTASPFSPVDTAGAVGGPMPSAQVPPVSDQDTASLAGGTSVGGPLPPAPAPPADGGLEQMPQIQPGHPNRSHGIRWGGMTLRNPQEVYAFEQQHGNHQSFGQFMNAHPALAGQMTNPLMRRAAVARARGVAPAGGGGPLRAAVARRMMGQLRGRA